jgi:hypothetical protein
MRHVSAETMARFRQGDLSLRRSSQISTHLASCERCGAVNGDLGRVTALLASTQRPRMPDAVTARMQAALTAESAARAADRGAADRGAADRRAAADRAASARAARARAWWPRLPQLSSRVALRGLAAAAAAVVLAGGGYAIVASTGASPTPASSSAASSPAGAHAAAGAPGYAPLMVPRAAGASVQYRHDGRESRITPITTGTDFTRADLASEAAAAVVRYGAGFAMTAPNAAGPTHAGGSLGRASAASAGDHAVTFGSGPMLMMAGCVNRIDAGNLVLLVDVAHYEGAPATVIVTEAAATGPMRIWVVGTGCSASRSDVLAHAMAATP